MKKNIETVLLVEDNADYLSILERYFTQRGYVCGTAVSGEDALRVLEGSPPPDLIISDLDMPGLDGLSLLRTLAREDGTPPCPFILITGKPGADTRAEALAAGAHAMLEKPFRMEALLALVQELETA
jgi:CheY-like chemotaxis protein